MKKIFFSSICVIITSVLFSQIPNSGFENWTSMGSYSNPDDWATLNNTTAIAGVYTATKGTPGSPGTGYLKLTSKTVATTVVNGIAVSGKLDSTTLQPISGFAFTQRPQSFTGKWQHMIYGASQGSLSVALTRWDATLNQRINVATANQTLSGMAMSWANFTINFVYTDGSNPDTCIIVLKASGAAPTNNDYLWVDNLAFSGTVLAIENNTSAIQSVSAYPNPVKGNLLVQLNLNSSQRTSFELFDYSGKIVRRLDVALLNGEVTQTLDVSGLPAGIYSLRISCEEGTATRKIIVQ